MENSIKVIVQPSDGWHAYQEEFYDALKAYEIEALSGVPFTNTSLLESDAKIVHFHWIERLWDCSGVFNKIKAVLGIKKYLHLARKLGKTVVWTVHNHYPHERPSRFDKYGINLFIRHSDVILCHSNWSAKWIESHGGKQSKIIVAPHGNFEKTFKAAGLLEPQTNLAVYGLDPSVFTIVMAGVIRENKGYETIIEAVKALDGTVQLLIIGRDKNKRYVNELKEMCRELDFIKVKGKNLSDAEYNEVILLSDLTVLPYKSITTSGAFVSSLTIGTPVLTSNLPFFKEFEPSNPHAGCVVQNNDISSWAEAINAFAKLERDSTRSASVAESRKYSWGKTAPKIAKRVIKEITKHEKSKAEYLISFTQHSPKKYNMCPRCNCREILSKFDQPRLCVSRKWTLG